MIIIIIIVTVIVTIIRVAMAVDSIWWQTFLTCYRLHPVSVPRRGRDAREICRLTVTSCGSDVVAGSVQTFPMTGNRALTACFMEAGNPFKAETWIADLPKITRQTTIFPLTTATGAKIGPSGYLCGRRDLALPCGKIFVHCLQEWHKQHSFIATEILLEFVQNFGDLNVQILRRVFGPKRNEVIGNGENCIMKRLVICTPYRILCGW